MPPTPYTFHLFLVIVAASVILSALALDSSCGIMAGLPTVFHLLLFTLLLLLRCLGGVLKGQWPVSVSLYFFLSFGFSFLFLFFLFFLLFSSPFAWWKRTLSEVTRALATHFSEAFFSYTPTTIWYTVGTLINIFLSFFYRPDQKQNNTVSCYWGFSYTSVVFSQTYNFCKNYRS